MADFPLKDAFLHLRKPTRALAIAAETCEWSIWEGGGGGGGIEKLRENAQYAAPDGLIKRGWKKMERFLPHQSQGFSNTISVALPLLSLRLYFFSLTAYPPNLFLLLLLFFPAVRVCFSIRRLQPRISPR